MIGYTRKEIVNRKKWSDLILPEQQSLFERHWETLLKGEKVSHYHYTLIHRSGALVYVVLYATARFDKQGKIINTRGIVVDITPRKKMEAILKVSQEKIKTQQLLFEEKSMVFNEVLTRSEIEKRKIQQNIFANMEHCVFPALAELKRKLRPVDRRRLEVVEGNLRQLTTAFGCHISDYRLKLTPREIEIANMIKNGFTTKEIAETLNVSLRTVDNHRNHIRKKLKIANKNISLAAYLQTLT